MALPLQWIALGGGGCLQWIVLRGASQRVVWWAWAWWTCTRVRVSDGGAGAAAAATESDRERERITLRPDVRRFLGARELCRAPPAAAPPAAALPAAAAAAPHFDSVVFDRTRPQS